MKITIIKNYSKLDFIVDKINVTLADGLALYGVEVCVTKDNKLFIRHGKSYKKKDGTWGYENFSFISKEIALKILEAYRTVKTETQEQTSRIDQFANLSFE